MPSKSSNENSENKTSLSRRTFVVGSGVEPLAHYCSGNCSTMNPVRFLSYHNHIKELSSGFQTIWCSKLVTITSGTFLLSSRFLFKDMKTFSNRQIFFYFFSNLNTEYLSSPISFKLFTNVK
jgi:hypothetical protein